MDEAQAEAQYERDLEAALEAEHEAAMSAQGQAEAEAANEEEQPNDKRPMHRMTDDCADGRCPHCKLFKIN